MVYFSDYSKIELYVLAINVWFLIFCKLSGDNADEDLLICC
jgi:hypothetical protein